ATRASVEDLSDYSVVCLVNFLPFSERDRALFYRVEQFVNSGGGLSIFLTEKINPADYQHSLLNSLLPGEVLGKKDFSATNTKETQFVSLTQIDFRHLLMSEFRESKKGDLTLAHFFSFSDFKPSGDTKILAKFTDGSPAILERTINRGRVILFPFGLNPLSTDLQFKAVFVPLIHKLVRYLATQEMEEKREYLVGEAVERKIQKKVAGNILCLSPSGAKEYLEPKNLRGEALVVIRETNEPGIYKMIRGNEEIDCFAVNVNTEESNVERSNETQLASLFKEAKPVLISATSEKERLSSVILQSRYGQELWKACLWMAFILMILEMVIRGWPFSFWEKRKHGFS
ncbi:MAG: hypothetical protein AB1393_14525, partial [Candidatus Edwardsbacteria bacterium]